MSERHYEWALALAAAACALAASQCDGAPAAHSLGPSRRDGARIVVWNVGGASGQDGSPLRDEHLPAVAATLRALDFDLACVLELRDAGQAKALARAVADDARAHTANGPRPLALIVRRGALATELGALRGPRQRPIMVMQWHSERLGTGVALGALHASPWSARERNEQLGALVDILAQRAGARACVALGDFNLEAQIAGRQDLFSDDAHLDLQTYGYATRTLADCGRLAGATAAPDRRIDYVLASPRLTAAQAHVFAGQRSGDMDHDPLVVDVCGAGEGR